MIVEVKINAKYCKECPYFSNEIPVAPGSCLNPKGLGITGCGNPNDPIPNNCPLRK